MLITRRAEAEAYRRSKKLTTYFFRGNTPQIVCNILARAVIVTLGFGRPSAAEKKSQSFIIKILDFSNLSFHRIILTHSDKAMAETFVE